MYCHKCGKPEQDSDSFCRSCGSYLLNIDKLTRKFIKKNSPETNINKNLLTNIITIFFSVFMMFSIALIFAGETFSILFIHLPVLISFIIGGWQAANLVSNLKLKKLIKEKRFKLASEKSFKELSESSFYNLANSNNLDKTTSGSLVLPNKYLE